MPSSQFISPFQIPTKDNIHTILQEKSTRFWPVEQVRWNQSNIDLRFWAGDQNYVNEFFNFTPNYSFQNFYFNIIQQPCNMVSGYQRQHRKQISYTPVENSDNVTATQLSRVIQYANNKGHLLEKFSESCESSLVTGINLLQPYLDYSHDPVNGELDIKIWHYNSFMMDPYWRQPDMSDCNWVWCQRFISKQEAMAAFPQYREQISHMAGYSNREGRFYFLPENYNIARHDLLVLSYYWFRTLSRRKMLYNRKTEEITEWLDTPDAIKEYTSVFDELEEIEVEVPTWNVGTLLNQTCLYFGENPLGFDTCPFVPVYWNYNPEIAQYDLRVRSLVRTLRDAQFLFNRRVILNHDISESSVNSGWLRRENAIANEENLRYSGQGKDIITKDEYREMPLNDIIQKIQPNAVPPSDLQLAEQLMNLINPLSGVNPELMGMAQDTKAGITEMLRQGAGLVTLQKYFDQWDRALKQLGMLELKIIQANWSYFKVARILNEQPTDQFFTKNFQKYDTIVSEGLNTTVQQQTQFSQLLEFQQMTDIKIPAELLLKYSTFHGKDELIQALQQQEMQSAEMNQQRAQIELATLEQQLQNLQADTAEKLAMAQERVARKESNVGLREERESEVIQNRAKALKDKISALKELIDTMETYGKKDTFADSRYIEQAEEGLERDQNLESIRAKAQSSEQRVNLANLL